MIQSGTVSQVRSQQVQSHKAVSFYFQLCLFSTLLPLTLRGSQSLRGKGAAPSRETHQKKEVLASLPHLLSPSWTHQSTLPPVQTSLWADFPPPCLGSRHVSAPAISEHPPPGSSSQNPLYSRRPPSEPTFLLCFSSPWISYCLVPSRPGRPESSLSV